MARSIHGDFHEDNYMKYECHNCKRKFIVGELLANGRTITCPYCQSPDVETTAIVNEEKTEEMQMGCVGIYFHTYPDGELMLYAEKEFAQAISEAFSSKELTSLPLGGIHAILRKFCEKRDGR